MRIQYAHLHHMLGWGEEGVGVQYTQASPETRLGPATIPRSKIFPVRSTLTQKRIQKKGKEEIVAHVGITRRDKGWEHRSRNPNIGFSFFLFDQHMLGWRGDERVAHLQTLSG